MLRIAPAARPSRNGLSGELETVLETIKNVPLVTLQELKGDANILRMIDDAEALLKSLRKALSSQGNE